MTPDELNAPAVGRDDLSFLDALPDPPPGLGQADYLGCRWIEDAPVPLRPGMYCCKPTALGSSWCAQHGKIVWAYRRTSLRPAGRKPPLS